MWPTKTSLSFVNSGNKKLNLVNVILNVSGLVHVPLKILKTCARPLIIMILRSQKLNEAITLLSFHPVLLIFVIFGLISTHFRIALCMHPLTHWHRPPYNTINRCVPRSVCRRSGRGPPGEPTCFLVACSVASILVRHQPGDQTERLYELYTARGQGAPITFGVPLPL